MGTRRPRIDVLPTVILPAVDGHNVSAGTQCAGRFDWQPDFHITLRPPRKIGHFDSIHRDFRILVVMNSQDDV